MVAERVVFSDGLPSQSTAEALQSTADALCETEPRRVRWTTAQFHQMIAAGLLDHRRVELIEGEIFEMAPMLRPHALSIVKTAEVLRRLFAAGHWIQTQLPLPIGQSEIEPDVAVFAGSPDDFRDSHPTAALLIVEISDSTLRYDQTVKAALYARAAIADYWIVNIPQRQLEVRRQPIEKADEPFGWSYGETQILTEGQSVAPLSASDSAITTADLLP